MRAIIVDDELHAREEMEVLLRETDEVEVVASCTNAVEALKAINKLRPDVVFLDIQMPVIDGFELLNMVAPEIMPHVVFVTAYDQYSLKAFEEKTLDYLLKPVETKRLSKTIDKLKQTLATKENTVFEPILIQRIPCLLHNRIKLIAIKEVIFISTTVAGVQVTSPEGEFFTEVTLKILEERTPLIRCHKQYLVNLDEVKEIILLDGGRAKLETQQGQSIPISRRYLKIIKQKLMI